MQMRSWLFSGEAEPKHLVKAAIDTPAVGVGGVIKGAGTLVKVGAGAVGGLILGSLLKGGIQQQQEATQQTRTDPKQDTRQIAVLEAQKKLLAHIRSQQEAAQQVKGGDISPKYIYEGPTITGGRDVSYVGPTTISEQTTITGATQEQFSGVVDILAQAVAQKAEPTQTVTVTPSQSLQQTATSVDSTGLIIIAAILGGAYLLKGKI